MRRWILPFALVGALVVLVAITAGVVADSLGLGPLQDDPSELKDELASVMPNGTKPASVEIGSCGEVVDVPCISARIRPDAGASRVRLDRYLAAATSRGWRVVEKHYNPRTADALLRRSCMSPCSRRCRRARTDARARSTVADRVHVRRE